MSVATNYTNISAFKVKYNLERNLLLALSKQSGYYFKYVFIK